MSQIRGNMGINPRSVTNPITEEPKPTVNIEEIRKLQEESCRNELQMQQMAMLGRAQIYRDNMNNTNFLKHQIKKVEELGKDPYTEDSTLKPAFYREKNVFSDAENIPLTLDEALDMVNYRIDDLDDLKERNLYSEPKIRTFKEIAAEKERNKMEI